ncbi:MAG: hypothetical protein D6820_00530 [Lentisphaerae bacterium]|nr:MAG: hypothetical protein D6820_00530 [Lentisphaerota bacterium]
MSIPEAFLGGELAPISWTTGCPISPPYDGKRITAAVSATSTNAPGDITGIRTPLQNQINDKPDPVTGLPESRTDSESGTHTLLQ